MTFCNIEKITFYVSLDKHFEKKLYFENNFYESIFEIASKLSDF
jgi:hypothetical protein